jgi:hypothetical protein
VSPCVNAAESWLLFAASIAETRPSLSASSFVNALEEVSIAATWVLSVAVWLVLLLVVSSPAKAAVASNAAPIPTSKVRIYIPPEIFKEWFEPRFIQQPLCRRPFSASGICDETKGRRGHAAGQAAIWN